jgi:hypothetical protein
MGYYDFKTNSVAGQSALYLGTFTSGAEIDVSAKYSKYGSLTADNFAVVPTGGSTSASYQVTHVIQGDTQMAVQGTGTATYTFSKSYNSSTGKLTITNTVGEVENGKLYNPVGSTNFPYYKSNTTSLSAKVYLLPSIQDVS